MKRKRTHPKNGSDKQITVTPIELFIQGTLFLQSVAGYPHDILVPQPGIEPMSPVLTDGLLTTEPPGKPYMSITP